MRVRVPDRLRSIIGKREKLTSFGNVSKKDACRLGWNWRAEVEREFEAAEVQLGLAERILPPPPAQGLTDEQLSQIAKRFLRELEANTPPIPIDEAGQAELFEAVQEEALCLGQVEHGEDATVQAAAENFAEKLGLTLPLGAQRGAFYAAIQEAWLEHLERQALRLKGSSPITVNPAFAGVNAKEGGENIGLTLAEAVQKYMAAPERSGNTASTLKMDGSRLGTMRDIIGGHRAVSSITRADIRDYVELLRKLPAHYTQRFRGMTPHEAIEAGERAGAGKLSATSIQRDMQSVRSLFGWLEREEYVEKNPTINIAGPKAPKKSTRRPYTAEEMQALLKATSADARGSRDWAYWCTRITILHGLRITEPLGLQVRDLMRVGDIWVFRLRPNEHRGLKTDDTARDLPVHPRLLELGILTLIDNREPDDLLLADVPRSKGKAFNGAQKQMGRLIRHYVSQDPDLTFHSLRHSFRDEMTDREFPREIQERLGGWTSGSGSAMDGYGRGPRLERLREWISKIAPHGLHID